MRAYHMTPTTSNSLPSFLLWLSPYFKASSPRRTILYLVGYWSLGLVAWSPVIVQFHLWCSPAPSGEFFSFPIALQHLDFCFPQTTHLHHSLPTNENFHKPCFSYLSSFSCRNLHRFQALEPILLWWIYLAKTHNRWKHHKNLSVYFSNSCQYKLRFSSLSCDIQLNYYRFI